MFLQIDPHPLSASLRLCVPAGLIFWAINAETRGRGGSNGGNRHAQSPTQMPASVPSVPLW